MSRPPVSKADQGGPVIDLGIKTTAGDCEMKRAYQAHKPSLVSQFDVRPIPSGTVILRLRPCSASLSDVEGRSRRRS